MRVYIELNENIDNISELRAYIKTRDDKYIGVGGDIKIWATEKKGRWEWNQYDYNPNLGNWHCSECGSIVIECIPKKDPNGIPLYKYCPQCGCRLVEPQESEDKE